MDVLCLRSFTQYIIVHSFLCWHHLTNVCAVLYVYCIMLWPRCAVFHYIAKFHVQGEREEYIGTFTSVHLNRFQTMNNMLSMFKPFWKRFQNWNWFMKTYGYPCSNHFENVFKTETGLWKPMVIHVQTILKTLSKLFETGLSKPMVIHVLVDTTLKCGIS